MKRRDLALPSIALDRSASLSLYDQISRQIAGAIRSGQIRKGSRLPSTRTMARLLRVSRNTVLTAYEELVADGLIAGEPGAGMRVTAEFAPISMPAFGLRAVIRDAHFPAGIILFNDPDGNPLYLNCRGA